MNALNSRRKEVGQCAYALVFPGADQRVDIPLYRNVSYVHTVLSSGSWSGSGYDDDGIALYFFRTTDSLSGSICA
jgi:hypothetical protein